MKRIAELRKEKHLNQTGLAMKLNVSQKMISAYESGMHQPSVETLQRMSEIFGVSVEYIIGSSNVRNRADELSEEFLSEKEIKLLDIFKQLSSEKQSQALGVLFALKNL